MRDIYRVNFQVTSLKPFLHLAFPLFPGLERSLKDPGFDGQLMASTLTCSDPATFYPLQLFPAARVLSVGR